MSLLAISALLLLGHGGPDIATLDAIAKSRDVAALRAHLAPGAPDRAINVIKTGGAYGVGRFGWRAFEMTAPGGAQYVVLSTPMTSQDVGELVFRREGDRLVYVPESDAMGVKIVRHDLEVRFNPAKKRVDAKDTVALTAQAAKRPEFLIRMSPYLRVSKVTAGGKDVPFAQAGGVVALPVQKNPSSLTIEYGGESNLPEYAGSVGADEAQLTNDYWYPMIARQPAPYALTVHTPKDWIAVGQGDQVSSDVGPDSRTTKFKMDMPVVYFSLSAGPYKTFSQTYSGRKLGVWSKAMPQADMKRQTELYAPIFDFYSKTFGPYPFSGYGALVTDLYGGGALEAYSFATYGTGWLPDEDAHEPAHTWFGGVLNNTYLNSLWNESFAEFASGLYKREGPIGKPEAKRLVFIQDAEGSQAYERAPLADSPPEIGPASSALGYGKGAAVLQMLEQQIGTPTMQRTLREWVSTTPKGQPVEWIDYEKVVRNVTGQDLTWFFDQWVRRAGYPKFQITDVVWESRRLTGNLKWSGEPYRLNMDVLVQYPDGKRQFLRLDTTETQPHANQRFVLDVPNRPALVSFDPWRRLLRDQQADEEPLSLRSFLPNAKVLRDPKHPEYLTKLQFRNKEVPKNLSGAILIGHPDTHTAMRPFLAKAGIKVVGNKLTYKNTTIDLKQGGALAVVDMGTMGRTAVGLGQTELRPDVGRASVAIFDRLGRVVDGTAEPKTQGHLTVQMRSNKLNPIERGETR